MIDDLRARCQQEGITVVPKILLDGFSASGSFVNRFVALHPELVQAAVSGGVDAVPILPTEVMDGERLIYPVGIADLAEMTGSSFDLAQYAAVPQFIYMGAEDTNDTLPYEDCFGEEERNIIKKVLGHEITPAIQSDMIEFFRKAME